MKTFKTIVFIGISLIFISALALRIKKVLNDKSTSIRIIDLKEGHKFVAATYYPITKEVTINDSITFYPGIILVQDEVVLKHHFLIFSAYFERSPTKRKFLSYYSNGNPNKFNLIIQATREGTSFSEIFIKKNQEKLKPILESYALNDGYLKDNYDRKFATENFEKLDTLKFYIKKALINSSTIGEYKKFELTLEKEPLDSLLYVKNKKTEVARNN